MSEEGVERKLTTILAADVVGYSRLMSVDEAGMLFAINNAFYLMYAGESVRSLALYDRT